MDNKIIWGLSFAIILATGYLTFGLNGVKALGGFILFFFLPTYLLLWKFDIEERIIFSIFASVGLMPAIIYWLGTIISFKLAIIISAILVALAAAIARRKELIAFSLNKTQGPKQ